MYIKKITKTDKNGKRLFVELGKKLKNDDLLPGLKKGDEVAILPMRKLTAKQMEKLVDQYVKYFDMTEEDSVGLCFEGVIKLNKSEFWEPDEKEAAKKKYALLDPELGIIDSFDDLNGVFDLQVFPGKERFVNKVACYKCKKLILEGYKYCPYCRKFNKAYKKED